MLVFRDVGMDLDKPILSRDVFLVLKYFRYGIEFAVDNELERMLRYFNEHALNEMKIIQNSKLMRGPAVLSRKRSHMSREVSISGMPTPFPHLKAAKMHQFCVFSEEIEEKVKHLIGQDSVFGVQPYKSKKNVGPLRKKHFNEQDQQQLTVFSQFTFHKPAVVIYTQLGQKMGAQADLEWRRLAYETINPSLAEYFSKTNDRHGGRVLQGLEQHKDGLRQQVNLPTHGVRGYRMPISVFSLRSMDVYKYRWVHRLYVRRFAQSLYSTDGPFVESATDSNVRGLLVASSTFVGSKLLAPFYSGVGLRNYLSPHVMLVDHEGIVRWLSAGCPDEHEREYFPRLLRQLEEEYYQSRR
ncbi:hypothetical protein ERJ75_000061000 [Trypanosoma vivax]|nr:hypothetical protein TRVL_01512 [Trypanosoma vivax]KAH8620616.1 hypothetical protein ERJ75_000061000 [Trypanosoma vivax]